MNIKKIERIREDETDEERNMGEVEEHQSWKYEVFQLMPPAVMAGPFDLKRSLDPKSSSVVDTREEERMIHSNPDEKILYCSFT